MRHLPNLVTASRGLAGLLVAGLAISGHNLLAFWTFILAISSDLVDGWLARRLDARSSVGVWLDPFADKMLVACTWAALLWIGWAPVWLAGTLLFRDVMVVLAWLSVRSSGRRVVPTLSGRLMISYEGVALPVLLVHGWWMGTHWMTVGILLGGITLMLAAWSSAEHTWALLRADP
jgi:cardiolipin synthase